MNLQEPELCDVIKSGTSSLPPAPAQVGLINEAQLRHGPVELGKMDPDPSEDNVNHTQVVPVAVTDPIYMSPPKSDSEDDREVFLVGEGEKPPEKTVKEIAREAEEEIARAAHLARRERSTLACRMTLGHRAMSLGMALLHGGTTQSSTLDTLPIKIDSETGDD
jgi:hypothetical protein